MSLRRKLILLLSTFAAFAVVAAAVTIYGIQWRVESAAEEFKQTIGQSVQIDRLHLALREQLFHFREMLSGVGEATAPYFAAREGFSATLRQVVRFVPEFSDTVNAAELLALADELEKDSDECLARFRTGPPEEAQTCLQERVESRLVPELETRLRLTNTALEEARHRTTRALSATASRTLTMTIVIGACAAGLVVLGGILIRRWLFAPIGGLQTAARHFAEGDFQYRLTPRFEDELGTLGRALNGMAQRVADVQSELRASEIKHRMLFRNLRDAVVLCDLEGRVVEHHDSDTSLLGVEGNEYVGRLLPEAWPEWAPAFPDWPATIEATIARGKRFRAVSVQLLKETDKQEGETFCDFLVYRVESGSQRLAAIVVRDVTERHRLQSRLRRAETLEAVGTLASGLAHDFNNLLAGVTGTLSFLAGEIGESKHGERIRAALHACWQAAALSRRLLNFATSAHGNPQVFRLGEIVETILGSLDASFLEGIAVHTDLGGGLRVRMDRDQCTQVVLNLLRNARDAMPDGGMLSIGVESAWTRDPDEATPERPHAVLVVRDTGLGMTPEVQRRVFEPLFTTKSRASGRGRGLGMAVVYSAVKNAGGFIRIQSEPGAGTTVRVFLALTEEPIAEPSPRMETSPSPDGAGTVLLYDDDPLTREAWRGMLERWGYSVIALDDKELDPMDSNGRDRNNATVAIIDVSQHGGDGMAVAERLVARQPSMRIIFTTASTEGEIPSSLERHIHARLLKPFRMEELASTVAGAILKNQNG